MGYLKHLAKKNHLATKEPVMKTKAYIGTKIIRATPMTLGAYNNFRGWTIPDNEDPARPGYLVIYPDGYKSWSPAEVFNESYRLLSTGEISTIFQDMDFRATGLDDKARPPLDLDEFPIVGEVKITGGDKSEEPIPFAPNLYDPSKPIPGHYWSEADRVWKSR